ncbi:MAG: tryptophan--tRNA ligase [Spirochaetota bacterium]|nr:tryptophan--tRNA ligase [Spirochaetota bacterium]
MKEKVFSGIQPSGEIHIGNYLGAIKNWVSLIEQYDCIFCVVDYHAITIKYDVNIMQKLVWNAILDNISCGIDPLKAKLFIQSHVPEHTELSWILSSVTSMGDLERMTQFKDKAKQHKDNINAGLFTYPVLQTADIILYKATKVPVGEDQIQHIELAREITRNFNYRYGKVFPEPKELISNAPRIIGLDGRAKMSKSMNNYISLNETYDNLKNKLMTAMTDENRKRRNDPGNPKVCNIYNYHQFFTLKDKYNEIGNECRNASIGCVDCKKILIEAMWSSIKPIQDKRMMLETNIKEIKEIIYENGKVCKKIAEQTIKEVKEHMGMN